MLLQQSIEHVSIVNTCNTYALVHAIYSEVTGQCSHKLIEDLSCLLLLWYHVDDLILGFYHI